MDEWSANPFRRANLRLVALLRDRALAEVPFICECENPACFETVTLSAAEFEQLCAEGGFAVVSGHALMSGLLGERPR